MGRMVEFQITDAVCAENEIWMAAKWFNGLLCMDKATKEVALKATFPNEKYSQENLYLNLNLIEGKIYCIPYAAKTIAIYNIKDDTFESITLDTNMLQYKGGNEIFIGSIQYENYLYMFPAYGKAIVRMDIHTYELIYITEWAEQLEKNCYNEYDFFFYKQSFIKDNKIFIPFCNVDAMLELACDSLKCRVYQLSSAKSGYSGISYDGNDFWMSAREDGDLTRWNPKTNELERNNLYTRKSKEVCKDYVGLAFSKGMVTVFSSNNSENREEKTVENASIQEGQYFFVKETNDSIIYFEWKKCELTIVGKERNDIFSTILKIQEQYIDISRIFSEKPFVEEISEFSLQRMLTEIGKDEKVYLTDKMEKSMDVGNAIYSEYIS